MKKILILIILIIFPTHILAMEECNNMYITKSYKEYKWYNTKEESSYFLLGNNDKNYNLLDKNDYIYTEFSNWSLNQPKQIEGRIIKNKKEYVYKELLPIKYIYINNIKSEKKVLKLDDIRISNSLNIICENCSKEKDFYNLNEGSYLKIELDENFDIEKFDYEFIDIEYLELFFSCKDDLEFISYNGIYKDKIIKTIKLKDYYKEFTSSNLIDKENTLLTDEIIMYQYQDILYRYYKKIRDYSDIYSKDKIKGYEFKDEDKFLLKYECDSLLIDFDKKKINIDENIKNYTKNKNFKINLFYKILFILFFILGILFIVYKKHKK